MWTWRKDNPQKKTRIPYSCNSWRCEVCQRHEAAVCFARIKEACERDGLASDGWVFSVLTLDRNAYYGGKVWQDTAEAYRELGRMTRKFLKRINRMCERRGWAPLERRWVAVVEAHESGWPHLNLVLYCPELAAELAADADDRLAEGATKRESVLLGGELARHAVESGWGPQSTAERARSDEALWGYIVKLCRMGDATTGELAKITQAPLNAPPRFRRLRSGKGFLPPRRTDPNVTGCLIISRRAPEGDWEVRDSNASGDAERAGHAEQSRRLEWQVIEQEEELAGLNVLLVGAGLPKVRQELIMSSTGGRLSPRAPP